MYLEARSRLAEWSGELLNASMSRLQRIAARAWSASPDEWETRARQAWFTLRNRRAAARGGSALPAAGALGSLGISETELTPWFETRGTRWFMTPERESRLARAWCEPGSGLTRAREAAQIVRDGRMPLFSYAPVAFDETKDWARDPILRRNAPREFYAEIDSLDVESVGDHKLVWEPSRFAFTYWLGLAERFDGDAGFGDRFERLSSSWFDANPYPIGVHYCSALEVAFRAYAWVWGLALFRDRLCSNPRLLAQLIEGIWTACHHVEANLSRYFSPNTHLTGEALGLYACGAALPEFEEASRWRELGGSVLAEEAGRQFYEDGTHRELSSGYHLYSTDFYLQATRISQESGFDLAPEVAACARAASERLAVLTPRDGVLPQWNDCDGGRLLSCGEAALDARPTLACAEAMFPGVTGESRPLRGYALLIAPEPVPTSAPVAFSRAAACRIPDSGIAAHENAFGDYVVFRASGFGYHDCPHSHDAALSVLVYLAGEPIVVDSGTGHYTRDLVLRDRFRSSEGKNVLQIGGIGPSVPDGWFGWRKRTDASLDSFETTASEFCAQGHHRGYTVQGAPVRVERAIRLTRGRVEIRDRWRAEAPVAVATSLTLMPGIRVGTGATCLQLPSGAEVRLSCSQGDERTPVHSSQARIPYSPNYGSVGETVALRFDLGMSASGESVTELVHSRAPQDSSPQRSIVDRA